jgi:hypothetical protein
MRLGTGIEPVHKALQVVLFQGSNSFYQMHGCNDLAEHLRCKWATGSLCTLVVRSHPMTAILHKIANQAFDSYMEFSSHDHLSYVARAHLLRIGLIIRWSHATSLSL